MADSTTANPSDDPMNPTSNTDTSKPTAGGERHTLPPESELRLEIPPNASLTIILVEGSAEIFGAELATSRPYVLSGTKIAIFTWHGCKIDVVDDNGNDASFVYMSEETDANIAYVNTHAQLEAMRDEALNAIGATEQQAASSGGGATTTNMSSNNAPPKEPMDPTSIEGPRVLLCGPSDCGKSSLARTLLSYASKLGRTPLLIDIDSSQNMLSVPGTIAASPITSDCMTVKSASATSTSILGNTTPLVLWYGSTDITTNPDLYKAQLTKLGKAIDERLQGDVDARSSGFIVNTSGHVEDDTGYKLLLHAAEALRCNVILVVGHDRLYSMLNTYFTKKAAEKDTEGDDSAMSMEDTNDGGGGGGVRKKEKGKIKPKVIKLPRSGGVVSRDVTFRRMSRSQCIKRYFNGDVITPSTNASANAAMTLSANSDSLAGNNAASASSATGGGTVSIPSIVHQYTPFALEIPFADLTLHKLTSVSLAASMLPVSAKQSTDPVQLLPIHDITPTLKHAILAVCHPSAVQNYNVSGTASDLYLSGVAGFVAVENVDMSRDILSLLSPCSGSLPSFHLLVGDITWME